MGERNRGDKGLIWILVVVTGETLAVMEIVRDGISAFCSRGLILVLLLPLWKVFMEGIHGFKRNVGFRSINRMSLWNML